MLAIGPRINPDTQCHSSTLDDDFVFTVALNEYNPLILPAP